MILCDIMERIAVFLKSEKKISKLIISFLLSFVFVILVGVPVYETNDDQGMTFLALGTYDGYDEHLVFVNTIIGFVIKGLMTVVPSISWYPVLEAFIIFVSIWIIVYEIISISKIQFLKITLLSLFFLGFGVSFWYSLQFTEVAGMSTISGTILLVNSWKKKNENWVIGMFIGGLLMLVGACYRFECFEISLGSMSIFLLYRFLNKTVSIHSLILVGHLALIVIISFGLKHWNNSYYQGDSEWNYYSQFNYYRAMLTDYGFPDYKENEDVYKSLNISEEDLNMFFGWNFADPDIFNLDSAKTIVAAKAEKNIDIPKLISLFFKQNVLQHTNYAFMITIIYTMLLVLVLCKNQRIWLLFEIIIFLLFQFYLYAQGRYMMQRVDICIGLAIFLTNVFIIFDYAIELDIEAKFWLGSMTVITCICYLAWGNIPKLNVVNRLDYELIREADENHLYLDPIFGNNIEQGYESIFKQKINHEYSMKNDYLLGGWGTYLPVQLVILDNYNIKNPFRDVINNPRVYLTGDGTLNTILGYIQRHYDENAYAVNVKNYGGYYVYYILSKDVNIDNICEKVEGKYSILDEEVYRDNGETCIDLKIRIDTGNPYDGNVIVKLISPEGEEKISYITQVVSKSDSIFSENCRFVGAIEGYQYNEMEVYYQVGGTNYYIGKCDF